MLLFISFGGISVCAQEQSDTNERVFSIEQAYENLNYEEAEALAREALDSFVAFSPSQLVRIHRTLALVLFVNGEELESAEQFRAALTINPDLELDPVLVSPITLEFFAAVKGAFENEQTTGTELGGIRYVLVEDPRLGALVRSALLPGAGQRYKGQNTKGWVLTGLWAASVGGTILAHLQRSDAERAYLEETNPDLVAERFETYDTWHNVRGGLVIGALAIWVYAAADAITVDTREADQGFSVGATPTGFNLRLRF